MLSEDRESCQKLHACLVNASLGDLLDDIRVETRL
jgi:hypothetical protein